MFIIGQITPLLCQPKHMNDYVLKLFYVLEYCIAFLTVRNDPQEQFFDYGYTKDNSRIMFSVQKMKIPNSFKTTMFNKHKIQHVAGAFTTESSDAFFF